MVLRQCYEAIPNEFSDKMNIGKRMLNKRQKIKNTKYNEGFFIYV